MSNPTPQQRLAAMMKGVGAEQPATRNVFTNRPLEFRMASRGGNAVDAQTSCSPPGASNPPYSFTLSSVPRSLAPTTAAHAPAPQLFAASSKDPTTGVYSGQGCTQGNAGMYPYGSGGPGLYQGYAAGGAMMGQGTNARGNFGPPSRHAQLGQGAAVQTFVPSQGPAHLSQGIVVQHGVIRGGRPPSNQNGVVQKLSYECQARKFNPEFKVTVHDNASYTCDVVLKTRLIQGSKRFENAQEAKFHTAAKALKEVKQWPLPGPVSSSLADKLKQPLADKTNQPARGQQGSKNVKEEESNGSAQPMGSPGPSMESGVDMTDPIQARAFVEGYRMGQAAASRGSSTDVHANDTKHEQKQSELSRRRKDRAARSRSPRRDNRSRGRRSRSPARHFNGSRHDPKLPSSDKYRPTPILAYRNVDRPKQEESYGRLKEEDYAE